MGASIRFAGGRQSWRHMAIALVVAITFALPAGLARAVDVPFRIESGALVFEGVGHLENGQFTGQAQAETARSASAALSSWKNRRRNMQTFASPAVTAATLSSSEGSSKRR